MTTNERDGKKWTLREKAELIRLSREGKTILTISRALGRSLKAVTTKRHELAEDIGQEFVKRREQQQLTASQKKRVIKLYRDEFHSVDEVAAIVKTTTHFVRKTLKENNVPMNRRRIRTRLDRETLQKAVDSGQYTINGLATHFDTAYGTILNNIVAQNIDVTNLRKSNREEWTTKEIARLKELVESDLLFWEIGQELGRSAISCRTKAYSLGLSVRRDLDLAGKEFYREDGTRVLYWTEDETKELEQLYAEGLFIAEIAQRMKRSYASIQKKLSYMGLYQKYEAERQELYERSFEQIAKGGKNNG